MLQSRRFDSASGSRRRGLGGEHCPSSARWPSTWARPDARQRTKHHGKQRSLGQSMSMLMMPKVTKLSTMTIRTMIAGDDRRTLSADKLDVWESPPTITSTKNKSHPNLSTGPLGGPRPAFGRPPDGGQPPVGGQPLAEGRRPAGLRPAGGQRPDLLQPPGGVTLAFHTRRRGLEAGNAHGTRAGPDAA